MENATYTAIVRDLNQWTQDRDGSNVKYNKTWECGHCHRTLSAACKCLKSMGDAACSHYAKIECTDGNVFAADGYSLID